MIPAGLNFMATGCPYWSIDVGAFFTKSWDRQWFRRGEYPEGCKDPAYRELYCRMLQFATFLPVMRSHGSDTPREPWQFGNPGEPYYESILSSIRLRYRLLPYTYSIASCVSREGYTMTRALAFDFPDDAQVLDLKDEFMFGPSLLVAPITESANSRRVYLPKGCGWRDFYTNRHFEGRPMDYGRSPHLANTFICARRQHPSSWARCGICRPIARSRRDTRLSGSRCLVRAVSGCRRRLCL